MPQGYNASWTVNPSGPNSVLVLKPLLAAGKTYRQICNDGMRAWWWSKGAPLLRDIGPSRDTPPPRLPGRSERARVCGGRAHAQQQARVPRRAQQQLGRQGPVPLRLRRRAGRLHVSCTWALLSAHLRCSIEPRPQRVCWNQHLRRSAKNALENDTLSTLIPTTSNTNALGNSGPQASPPAPRCLGAVARRHS